MAKKAGMGKYCLSLPPHTCTTAPGGGGMDQHYEGHGWTDLNEIKWFSFVRNCGIRQQSIVQNPSSNYSGFPGHDYKSVDARINHSKTCLFLVKKFGQQWNAFKNKIIHRKMPSGFQSSSSSPPPPPPPPPPPLLLLLPSFFFSSISSSSSSSSFLTSSNRHLPINALKLNQNLKLRSSAVCRSITQGRDPFTLNHDNPLSR